MILVSSVPQTRSTSPACAGGRRKAPGGGSLRHWQHYSWRHPQPSPASGRGSALPSRYQSDLISSRFSRGRHDVLAPRWLNPAREVPQHQNFSGASTRSACTGVAVHRTRIEKAHQMPRNKARGDGNGGGTRRHLESDRDFHSRPLDAPMAAFGLVPRRTGAGS